jgi:hypothetical protein
MSFRLAVPQEVVVLSVQVEVSVVRRSLDRLMFEAIADATTRPELKVLLEEGIERHLEGRAGRLQPVTQMVAILQIRDDPVEVEGVKFFPTAFARICSTLRRQRSTLAHWAFHWSDGGRRRPEPSAAPPNHSGISVLVLLFEGRVLRV